MTGVVDNVLSISTDHWDHLANAKSINCAGIILAGFAIAGKGIVGFAKITDRKTISKGEVESVRACIIVYTRSVDDLVASEAVQTLEVDGVVVDARESCLILRSMSARLHVFV